MLNLNKDALLKYECLKQNDIFSTTIRNAISGNTVTKFLTTVSCS